jgi:hypothetical protein
MAWNVASKRQKAASGCVTEKNKSERVPRIDLLRTNLPKKARMTGTDGESDPLAVADNKKSRPTRPKRGVSTPALRYFISP